MSVAAGTINPAWSKLRSVTTRVAKDAGMGIDPDVILAKILVRGKKPERSIIVVVRLNHVETLN
jgi:predicted transcriptional regulator